MAKETWKEIESQPEAWEAVLKKSRSLAALAENEDLSNPEPVFIGCGSSYYLALSAASVVTHITGARAKAMTASDSLFYPEFHTGEENRITAFLISRSGKTTEVIWALDSIRNTGCIPTCAVSCRPGSELVKKSSHAIVLPEGDEKSVVMTRSFTCMLLAIQVAAMHRSPVSLEGIRHLPAVGRTVVRNANRLAEEIIAGNTFTKFVFAGQGPFYGLACESMLKIKEMALFGSEAYHSLEFRHGPISMADSSMLVTCFLSDRGRQEELGLLGEVRSLGARTLVVCDKADSGIRAAADFIFECESGLPEFQRLVLGLPVTQWMAYHAAQKKGLDPDHPRHLNQVVEIRKG